jgi:CBS domain-containing protein
MIKAKDIMTTEVVSVRPETDIMSAARLLLSKHFNGVPVVDDSDRILGIICQSDLIVQQEKIPIPSFFSLLGGVIPLKSPSEIDAEMKKIAALTVQDAMTPDPVTVSPDTGIDEIATLMVKKNIHTLPVQENGILVGIIGKEDILRTYLPANA